MRISENWMHKVQSDGRDYLSLSFCKTVVNRFSRKQILIIVAQKPKRSTVPDTYFNITVISTRLRLTDNVGLGTATQNVGDPIF